MARLRDLYAGTRAAVTGPDCPPFDSALWVTLPPPGEGGVTTAAGLTVLHARRAARGTGVIGLALLDEPAGPVSHDYDVAGAKRGR
ncbi:MAG: hypothetical protein GKR94_02845 [Gammaproteobacteria bacterium]|nr:hypothetical protein [Gammaproteobacteria bacterium]